MTRLMLCLVLMVSGVGVPLVPTAHAAPASPAKLELARSYADAGMAAQNAGDYDKALTFFSKAYDLVPHPMLLFDIAQAHRLAGREAQAIAYYRKYLATSPTGPEAQIAREILEGIEDRRAEEARRVEETRRVDAAYEALYARPEEPSAMEAPARRPALVMRGATTTTMWSTRRRIAVGVAGGGVLTLAAGGALGVSAKRQQSDAHALCPDPQLACNDADRANALVRSGHDRSIGANLAFGVGAAAVIAAGSLWLTGTPESAHRLAVIPAVSPAQVAVTASGSF